MHVRRLFLTGFVVMALMWLFEARAQAPLEGFSAGNQVFAPSDIVDARAQPDPDGTASILVTFESAAATRLYQLRTANQGKALPLKLGARLLAAPVIEAAEPGDVLLIQGGFSREDADRIALAISGKPPLPESLDESE